MTSLADLVRKASERLTADQDVDAGLGAVADAVQGADRPAAAARTATKLLRQRVRALHVAIDVLRQLDHQVAYLADLLPFTEAGWPQRRAELEERLGADPAAGLAAWLADWFRAASDVRLAALGRLQEVPLPPDAALLAERARVAAGGLRDRDWRLAEPLLSAGVEGLGIGGRTVPDEPVRHALRLVLIRLAIDAGRGAEVERLIAAAREVSPSSTVDALAARWRRREGAPDAERGPVPDADVPIDMDVAVELVERARAEGRTDVALEAARVAVDAVPVIDDVEAQVGRLLTAPPPEIWLADAERALREGDFSSYDRAVDECSALASRDEHVLQAHVAELRVQSAAVRGRPTAEQVSALLDAGSERVWADQPEPGIAHFERALTLDPGNVDATLRLADALLVLNWDQPLARGQAGLERGLRLIEDVRGREPMTYAFSWSYSTETYLRLQLLRPARADTEGAGWRAFLAVCRGLAHDTADASRWSVLSDAAEAVGLDGVAVYAARHAFELQPDEQSAGNSAGSLANAGRFDEALDVLGAADTARDQAIRAYVQLRLNEPLEAARLLRTIQIEATWVWARETLVSALLLTGRHDEAVDEAGILRTQWAERVDERAGAVTMAWVALWQGRFEEAEGLAALLAGLSSDALVVTGAARLLQGDNGASFASFRSAFAEIRRRRELEEWFSLIVPQLRVLARHHGVELPPLEELDRAAEDRLAVVRAGQDPAAELADVSVPPGADPAVVGLARVMGATLLALARDDHARALSLLDGHPVGGDDLELGLLHQLAGGPPTPINLQVQDESDDLLPVEEAPGPDQTLRLLLPPSWFADHPDPTGTHPLFQRYLLEARARMDGRLPGVQVGTREELEPDGYEIRIGDRLVEAGAVSPSSLYTHGDTTRLLAPPEAGVVVPEPEPASGLVRLTDAYQPDALGRLLTMPAVEVVTRRVERVARAEEAREEEARAEAERKEKERVRRRTKRRAAPTGDRTGPA